MPQMMPMKTRKTKKPTVRNKLEPNVLSQSVDELVPVTELAAYKSHACTHATQYVETSSAKSASFIT